MDSRILAIVSWSFGLCALAYGGAALRNLWLGKEVQSEAARARLPLRDALILVFALSAAWGTAGLAYGLSAMPGWLLAQSILDVLRYGAWLRFLLMLLGHNAAADSSAAGRRRLAIFVVVTVMAGILLHLAPLAFSRTNVPFGTAALGASLLLQVSTLFMLEQLLRNVQADSVWNIKPFCLGLGGAVMFDLYLYSEAVLFTRFDIDVYAIRGLVHTLVLPLIAMSVARTGSWTKQIRMSQAAAFRSVTLVVVGVYLLFIAGVGYYVRTFGGDWGRALQAALVFSALLGLAVLAVSRSIRAKLRVLIIKHFFSYRYDYREEWLRFTNTLSAQHSPQAMGEQVIRGLAELVESPSGSLWIRDGERPEFNESSRWNMPAVSVSEPADAPLCRFMESSGWVIDIEEYRSFPRRYESLRLPDWLSSLEGAWLVVPLALAGGLMGFVVLSRARTPMEVNWEVNDILRTAGRQAASFLEQMHATEALLEVRKFDAFNRMSAFVVHDLKNIVTQLSLMLRNAERHKDNPEFQADMMMTVGHSVERMRQLMLQLREGAAPPGSVAGADLAAIIERISGAKAASGREVRTLIRERLMTRGHEERMERVVGHLVQNAIDATGPDGGRVEITLAREGGLARIDVVDNGHGMTPEFIRERLFKPFQTTKSTGMGIGAYESFQYIQSLGGKVTVDSEVGTGTRISLLLPLFEPGAKSDLLSSAQTETA